MVDVRALGSSIGGCWFKSNTDFFYAIDVWFGINFVILNRVLSSPKLFVRNFVCLHRFIFPRWFCASRRSFVQPGMRACWFRLVDRWCPLLPSTGLQWSFFYFRQRTWVPDRGLWIRGVCSTGNRMLKFSLEQNVTERTRMRKSNYSL